MKNKILFFTIIFAGILIAGFCSAHLPRIVYNQTGDIIVQNPENSQAFYDELKGVGRNYVINSSKDFTLYINLLVPAINGNAKYSANIFKVNNGVDEKIAFIDGQTDFKWQEFYEEFGRDYYYKGPEWEEKLKPGNYKVQVFSYSNKGKYVLAVGKNEVFPIIESISVYWILPQLKMQFFQTSVLEFLFTPFGKIGIGVVGGIIVLILIISSFISIVRQIKNRKPKMMLLTSNGMTGSATEIMAILPKPAEDIRVAHIITASIPEEDKIYVQRDVDFMHQAGFNVKDFDIAGKNYNQVLDMLFGFDIIYVQGGNTFYLLKHMRSCNFAKVLKKLLSRGVIYIGVSAGSIVVGKNIDSAKWLGSVPSQDWQYPRERFGLVSTKGLGLVSFNILPHYTNELNSIIKEQPKKVKKKLKILQDNQAIFVLDKEISFVGTGEVVNAKSL